MFSSGCRPGLKNARATKAATTIESNCIIGLNRKNGSCCMCGTLVGTFIFRSRQKQQRQIIKFNTHRSTGHVSGT